eukprot:366456-Chlamydomonas_euryale.AAC.2
MLLRDFRVGSFPAAAPSLSTVAALLAGFVDGRLDAIRDALAELWGGLVGGFSPRGRTRPNDPYYTNGSQYYVDLVNATGAWEYMAGLPGVVVAVIDTGVDLAHPELAGKLWVNAAEVPGNGIDDDGNGMRAVKGASAAS